MKVVEHRPAAWFLLQKEEDFYIDVNCSSGFASFTVTVQLNSSEKMHYKRQGIKFIEGLGEIIAEKSEINHSRNIKNKELLQRINDSIIKWMQDQKK